MSDRLPDFGWLAGLTAFFAAMGAAWSGLRKGKTDVQDKNLDTVTKLQVWMEERLEGAREENKELRAEVKELRAENADLRDQLETLAGQLAGLLEDSEECHRKYEALERELSALRQGEAAA